ncbi:MAG: CPBP family intramembrane glutamic endopeptidase [Janthinobacterium lividum]
MPYSYPLSLLCWALLWGGLGLGLVAAKVPAAPRRVGLVALACALHALALVLPWQAVAATLGLAPVVTSKPLDHSIAWAGKAAALLVSVLFIYGLRWVSPAEVGLRSPRAASLRVVGAVVGAVALAVFATAYAGRQHFLSLWWYEGLFYSLVPGMEEELFYRGVLLGLVGPVFARTIPLPSTRTSWGGLAGVLLFGLGHSLKFFPIYNAANNILMSQAHLVSRVSWWQPLLYFLLNDTAYPLLMGLLFLWVRERTGSVWAAMAAHCLLNTALTSGRMLA